MPRQTTQAQVPRITISFFSTGLYTRRSQLFAPFRSIGINVVSYHDALLDGSNMEVTDLLEVQRRPGFSHLCSVGLDSGEIINQFYSYRNSAGTVLSFIDSNQRLALFSSDSITTIYNKTTTNQGFVQEVDNTSYFQDGVEATKYDTILGTTSSWGLAAPVTTPTIVSGNANNPGFWTPKGSYVTNSSLLDPNGNVQNNIGSAGTSGTFPPVWPAIFGSVIQDGPNIQWKNLGTIGTWVAGVIYALGCVILDSNGNLEQLTAQVAPPGLPQTANCYSYAAGAGGVASLKLNGTIFSIGEQVALSGFHTGHGFNGQTVTLTNVYDIDAPQSQVDFAWFDPNGGSHTFGSDNGIVTSVTPAATLPVEPTWSTTIGSTVSDGQNTWKMIGPGTALAYTGYSWTYAYRTLYGHLSTSAPVSTSTGPIIGPQTAQITSFSIDDSGVLTLEANNQFAVGQNFYVTGLSVGTYLNNIVYIATAVSATSISASTTQGSVSSTSDAGSANPVLATVSGAGCGDALCSYTADITSIEMSGNVITFTSDNNLVAGLSVTISGLSTVTQLNGWQFAVVSASDPSDPNGTPTQFTAEALPNMPFYSSNIELTSDSGTATFNAVEIYRTSDGGGVYEYCAAVTDPGLSETWTFQDYIPDNQLDIETQAPLAHLNDPPPGQPGSLVTQGGTIITYWQGRLYMAVGNRVYFDGGDDVINGSPHESWPPANVFSYPGPIYGLEPTEFGLLVFMSDRVDIIIGGPQTLTLYTQDFLKHFGVSSPNCLCRDGDTIYLYSTQSQIWSLAQSRQEEGTYVGDILMNDFSPTESYITMHRNGLDTGLFLSNGTDSIIRLGTNINAWSTLASPVGGVGALRSIETSPGLYSLCEAKAIAWDWSDY